MKLNCMVRRSGTYRLIAFLYLISATNLLVAQNSLVGDGFGGRLWYQPYNYTVGSYSAYSLCGDNRQLLAWGNNQFGQLGDGTYKGSNIPVEVTGMDNVYYFSTGYLMGAIRLDRSGWVWGTCAGDSPVKVIDSVSFVDAGINLCAFVKKDGTVWSVGVNGKGEFGDGIRDYNVSLAPKQMKNIKHAVRTAQGAYTTCVLLDDGTVWCAGYDGVGLIGDGNADTSDALVPRKTLGLSDIIDIKANAFTNIALDKNGGVWTWGRNAITNHLDSIPQKIVQLSNIVAISGCNDGDHVLALDSAKNCYSWGGNAWGQCGNGTISNNIGLNLVAKDVVDIMAGETFSYIVKSDGTLWATGTSNGASIWLNLTDSARLVFTQLNPNIDSFRLCAPSPCIAPDTIINLGFEIIPLFFPNAFSPNGDGANDIFKAILPPNSEIEHYQLLVFNRWGNLIFKTQNLHDGWNGKFQGVDQSIDNYFYLATYNLHGKNTRTVKGDLTLIR